MICDGDYNKLSSKRVKEGGLIEVIEKIDIIGETKKTDGMPPMEVSISGKNYRGFSTSKYLLNDEEDDKLSSISEMFEAKDDEKFIKLYNM